MPTRAVLIEGARELLAKAGFAVSERCDIRPISFDVMARRDETLLILKVLGNVDALSDRVAQELRTLARFLKGIPILLGERSSAGPLEDGVVYSHRDVTVLTLPTFAEYLLENQHPLAFASPGGLHVRLRGDVLRRLRQERELSLGILAQAAGVSRRAIQMYEEGMRATVESAIRLEEFLMTTLVEPIDPFVSASDVDRDEEPSPEITSRLFGTFEKEIFGMLRSVGFRVVPTGQSPFSAMSQEKRETILTGVDRGDASLERRATILSSVRAVTEKDSMIVVNKELRVVEIRGTPVVHQKELQKLRDPAELVDLLDERRKPAPKAP